VKEQKKKSKVCELSIRYSCARVPSKDKNRCKASDIYSPPESEQKNSNMWKKLCMNHANKGLVHGTQVREIFHENKSMYSENGHQNHLL
jgi:hypothetical protein